MRKNDLGVVISDNLSWDGQVSAVCFKVQQDAKIRPRNTRFID